VEILAQAQTKDFIDYGFEPEFIGRLPVRVYCHALSVDDLFSILKTSEGSIVRQYEETFSAYGIEVLFEDEALRQVATLAVEEQTGARGLMTVCERLLRDFKFELPSTSVRRLVVSREVVDNPAASLKQILAEQALAEHTVMHKVVHEFAERFEREHGLKLSFTEAAAGRLVALADAAGQPIRDLCALRFKDFQFGLKLIAQNTGQTEFTLDAPDIEAPDKTLSDWVVASYRATQEPAMEKEGV
jgi:ribosomal protein L14